MSNTNITLTPTSSYYKQYGWKTMGVKKKATKNKRKMTGIRRKLA